MTDFMDALLRWLPVIILIVQVIMARALWSLKQSFISRRECDDCQRESAEKKEKEAARVTEVEKDLGKLPERHELRELFDKIAILSASLGELNGRLSGINRAVDLLNQHHINNGA